MTTEAAGAEANGSAVSPANLAALRVSDFDDQEIDQSIPYYLAHFHRLANGVELVGPNRGFITLPVWRRERDNRPYNARVLENHVSLAYFYCTDRPWNPYRGAPAVRRRLEAVLDFLCRMQNDDGRFSEYGPKEWNLAATGFATMFLGGTLTLLNEGPPIDKELHQRLISAHKTAIHVILTDESLFDHGRSFSNQYSGLWGGMLAHLQLYPDRKLERLMRERLADTLSEHQSPAGYWYEKDGCDWMYSLRTHHGNLATAWHYARRTDVEDLLVQGETRWARWLSYNAVREPDGSIFVLNSAIETRRRGPFEWGTNSVAEETPLARAFVSTGSEIRAKRLEVRQELEATWPNVGPLDSYSPHRILNVRRYTWHPTDAQRNEAMTMLPYLAKHHFNHQRTDDRFPQVHTFVRRSSYYAAFNSGQRLAEQQRFGLGVLWTDDYGAVLQNQTGSRDAAWGTRGHGAEQVSEAELTDVSYQVGNTTLVPEPGAHDLDSGDIAIQYPLSGSGTKTVTFRENEIEVSIRRNGGFTEQLPLLVSNEASIDLEKGLAMLTSQTPIFEVQFGPARQLTTQDANLTVGGKRLVVLRISARNELVYRLKCPGTDRVP